MNPQGMTAWLCQGDGLKLWEDICAPFNIVPRPIPTSAPQMAGWFRKKINTIGDFKGLRMRIPNLGGKVVARAGGTAVMTSGGDTVAATQTFALTNYSMKNALALERLKTEFKGKVELVQLPAPVLRDLKKLSVDVVREQSEKTPMAKKVHASFTKFQALVGPWDHVAEGAYHQLLAGTT